MDETKQGPCQLQTADVRKHNLTPHAASRALRLALVVIALGLGASGLGSSGSGDAQFSFTLGPREDVLAVGAFGLCAIPDEHLGVLKIAGQYHAWFAADRDDMWEGATFHMAGPSLESMEVEVDASGKAKPVLKAGGWHAGTDFSSVQGQSCWGYQEWTGSSYRDMRFDKKDNAWHGSKQLSLLGREWAHPDSDREPARKWVSPIAGTVTISGNAHDADPGGGDGVVVSILKGSTELWSKTIANGDTKGYDFDLQVPVQVGDAIYFRVAMRGDPGFDSTYFNPSISVAGTFDNGYAGFASVYLDKASDEILAFYHAEDHEGVTASTLVGVPAYYASVGLAVSKDGGLTFEKMGQVLTSHKPKSPSSPDGAQGVGGPSVIVDPSGQYLYMYFMDWTREAPWGDIGVARSRVEDGGRPGTWFKYYNGGFTEPGLGGRATLIVGGRVPGDWAAFPSVSFNSYLNQYLMVYAAKDGFYAMTSGDGINWASPTQLLTSATGWSGSGVSLYPTIIGEDDTHTGKENWLYYGFTPKALAEECHHMVRQRITFSQ